ncbi:MAG: LLM class F420-dependent oxidoreductase [Microthrixaceae bacterium]|nr:LLM class F420-dependent oxidoreductase [Acidimicrobiales bacterium]MCB9404747.1 LLM class F420-dependent oxidoreductase [Microthrixaceae bacterium]
MADDDLKLGLHLGYWFATPPVGVAELVRAAEDLGFDSVWSAEAYGSDCFTPLAWHGASTSRVKLGTAVCQMSARTPVATAMSALTLDHLTNGRFMLGLGASGPQVVEGWYGQPYPRPLERTREYVDVVRQVLAREAPVEIDGRHIRLPNHDEGTTGLGKPLRSITHPLRADLPILLGAEGPKNVALAAEICDGWLPIFLSPDLDVEYRQNLAEGFARPGARHTSLDTFEVPNMVSIVIDDDIERAADAVRMFLGFYIGGMGAKEVNFHASLFARMGYGDVVEQIQDLFLAGRKDEAIALVPLALVEDVAMVGPLDKVREELDQKWRRTCMTTLLVNGTPDHLRVVADMVNG